MPKENVYVRSVIQGHFPSVFKKLPEIQGWVDDENYIENRNGETFQSMSKTGNAVSYKEPKEEKEPDIANAYNITFSPDKKFVAYTKNNNLYVTEVATKKRSFNYRRFGCYNEWLCFMDLL